MTLNHSTKTESFASKNLLYPPLPKLKRRVASTIVLMQFLSALRSKKWQLPTPVACDNSTAGVGITNQTIKQRRSKAINMQYYWLQDRECQDQFKIEWAAGADNKADYTTKNFSVSHHWEKRPENLHTK
jgi:hypothetical protein